MKPIIANLCTTVTLHEGVHVDVKSKLRSSAAADEHKQNAARWRIMPDGGNVRMRVKHHRTNNSSDVPAVDERKPPAQAAIAQPPKRNCFTRVMPKLVSQHRSCLLVNTCHCYYNESDSTAPSSFSRSGSLSCSWDESSGKPPSIND